MSTPREATPPSVPARDKQGGETHRRVAGAEPGVWSERMLEALTGGMKGNRWFSLIDKVHGDRTLELAWAKVRANAGGSGVDRITVERFAQDCPRGLLDLKEQLRTASYQPRPVKRVWIPKPGTNQQRPLGIPTVRDRVVQMAAKVVEPIFEADFEDAKKLFDEVCVSY